MRGAVQNKRDASIAWPSPCTWLIISTFLLSSLAGVFLAVGVIRGPPRKSHAATAAGRRSLNGLRGELDTPATQAYFEWLSAGGSKVGGLYFKMFERSDGRTIRGLAFDRDLKAGDVVMEISKKSWLNDESLPIASAARFSGLSLPSSKVGFFLAEELVKIRRGVASDWKPYIDMLPTYEDYAQHHPLAASPEMARDFHDLCVFSNDDVRCSIPVLHYWETMDKDYELYRKKGGTLLNKKDPTAWRAIRWAYMACLSRRFNVEGSPTLIPLAENLNTGPAGTKNVDWRSYRAQAQAQSSEGKGKDKDKASSTELFRVTAKSDTKAGEELLDSYGLKSDARLLLVYGFVLPENKQPTEQYSEKACKRLMEGVARHASDKSPKDLVQNLIRLSCQSCEHNGGAFVETQAACAPWRRPRPVAASPSAVLNMTSPTSASAEHGGGHRLRGPPGGHCQLLTVGAGKNEIEDMEELIGLER